MGSFAAKGFPVFKLSSSRRPLVKRFWESPPPDAAWNGNIGVATGGDLIVIDIDVKKGARGHESLAVLETLGLPRDTFTVRTTSVNPAGEPGLHLYYRVPAGYWRNRVGWLPGVDVKGDHGYVVGPGSKKGGRFYEIEADLPVQELPAAFLTGLAGNLKAAASVQAPEWADNAPAIAAATAYLVNEAPELGEGERDAGLVAIANRVLDLGISPAMATILIVNHWLDTKCFPPVPFEDVEEKVENAAKSRGDPIGFKPPPPNAAECFENETTPGQAEGPLRLIRPSELVCPAPRRSWIAPSLIPAKAVTLLSGDGGTGKSLLALQLCVAMALGRDWLNRNVTHGRTLYLSAEDDEDELSRRLEAIARHYNASFIDMDDIALLDRTSADALLGARSGAGNIVATTLHHTLRARIAGLRPALVVIDTLADTFGGDEIVRTQAGQFINLLRQLAPDAAILLLAHPSLSGMASGAGTSGSTGWHNKVRSRLYFKTGKDGVRTLTHMKANYGPLDAEVKLVWSAGVFTPLARPTVEEEAEVSAQEDEEFMGHVKRLLARGQTLTEAPGQLNAASTIARDLGLEGDAAKKSRRRFSLVMARLLNTNILKLEPYDRADRKKGLRLAVV